MGLGRLAAAAMIGIGALSIGTVSLAQPEDFDQVEIQTIPVADNIYMLVGEGGNIGVSPGADRVFLIDDQYAPLTAKIEAAIALLSDQPIRFLVNTHWHFDHTGGNENLGEAGVVIVAHDQMRTRMSTEQFIQAFQLPVSPSPSVALPVITFNDTTTFHLNGQTIHAFYVETAHTDGDTVIHFRQADVIHTGDIYFNGIYPFIDISSGGSIRGMISATEQILALAGGNTQIIPGHGPLSNRAELEAYRQMLVDVRVRTQAGSSQGLTLEEFLASNPTADYDAD